MASRFHVLLAGFLLVGLIAPQAPASAEPGGWVDPPAKTPRVQPRDRTRNLDFLFGALKVAPDDISAKAIEDRIWAVWALSPSPTATLLMDRVKTAIEGQDTDLAIRLLDSIVEIKPDYVEAWNRRATLYFMRGEYGRSMADIRHVLALEPRHFGAIAGMGYILQETGNDKQALEVFRRALQVHPRLKRVPDTVKTLEEKVEGRAI
ncbi:MAG: tetratricopeptide repeat protein [Pseudorhodoplanes sp.]